MKRIWCAIVVLTSLWALPAASDPTGVVAVPTADVLSHAEWRLKLQQDIASELPRRSGVFSQFGIGNRVEGGVDLAGAGRDNVYLGNVKARLWATSDSRLAAAAGVANIGDGIKPLYYGVVSGTSGRLRLHGGLAGDGHARAMLAAELAVAPRLNTFAEWMSGPGAPVSVGLQYQVGRRTGAQAYFQRLNNTDEQRFQIRIWHTGLFGR